MMWVRIPPGPPVRCLPRSSMVERLAVNETVAGSSPAEAADLPPWPSGDGTSLTWRLSPQVRVLPGVLRSGLEPGRQHGLISRPTPVQIRPPQLGLEVLRQHAALVSAEGRVRLPAGPLRVNGDACSKGARVPRTHPATGSTPVVSTDWTGLWSNGTTPARHAGDAGSTPAGSTSHGG